MEAKPPERERDVRSDSQKSSLLGGLTRLGCLKISRNSHRSLCDVQLKIGHTVLAEQRLDSDIVVVVAACFRQ